LSTSASALFTHFPPLDKTKRAEGLAGLGNDKAGPHQQLVPTGVPQLQVHEWSSENTTWGTEKVRKQLRDKLLIRDRWSLSPGEKVAGKKEK